MTAILLAFEDDHAAAERLAAQLGVASHPVHLHRFPDGEALPTVVTGHETVLIYRSLDRPDAKLLPLLLAADALRRGGTERIALAAPYLPYLGQDKVFAPGQPLSRDVLARVLGPPFDRIVTVAPHLHRTPDLSNVFPDREVTVLDGAELIARAVGVGGAPLVVGPDSESAHLVGAVAARLGAEALVLSKSRQDDREVAIGELEVSRASGRRVVLVDDICASGATLAAAAQALCRAGARSVDAVVVHALFDAAAATRLRRAGVRRVMSTDSCRHPTNSLWLAGLLADAFRKELET